jgi:hypothetical protein
MNRDFEYEKKNIAFDEQYIEEEGGGIKCKNYEVCNAVLPKWWFDCKSCYLCTNCDMMFGRNLTFKNANDCPICLEVKKGLSQPNCDHFVCMDCFVRCYYGPPDEPQPEFPYSKEVEEEYESFPRINVEMELRYPLLKQYRNDLDAWEMQRQEKFENEENLRSCPICRK